MMKRRELMACGYQPVSMGGFWNILPIFCCEEKKARKISHSHRKRSR